MRHWFMVVLTALFLFILLPGILNLEIGNPAISVPIAWSLGVILALLAPRYQLSSDGS